MNYMPFTSDCKNSTGVSLFQTLIENKSFYQFMVKHLYNNLFLNTTDSILDSSTNYLFDVSTLSEDQRTCLSVLDTPYC